MLLITGVDWSHFLKGQLLVDFDILFHDVSFVLISTVLEAKEVTAFLSHKQYIQMYLCSIDLVNRANKAYPAIYLPNIEKYYLPI